LLVRDHGRHGHLSRPQGPAAAHLARGALQRRRDRQSPRAKRRQLSRARRGARAHRAAAHRPVAADLLLVARDARSAMTAPTPIRELPMYELDALRAEMARAAEPFVLRGLARQWPAVRTAQLSGADLVRYLRRFDSGRPVDAVMTPPEVGGRIFYNDAMSG